MRKILSPPPGSVFLPFLTLGQGPKTTQEVEKRKLEEPLSSAQISGKKAKPPTISHTHCTEILEKGTEASKVADGSEDKKPNRTHSGRDGAISAHSSSRDRFKIISRV